MLRDLSTCQTLAPVALCCLIHAQSCAVLELFCHLYVENSFCVPDLLVFTLGIGLTLQVRRVELIYRASIAPCWHVP